MSANFEEQKARFRASGQEHVFAFWDQLSPSERESLLAEACSVDLDEVERLGQLALAKEPPLSAQTKLEPPTVFPLQRSRSQESTAAAAQEVGYRLLRQGQVAFLVVAGGQGSRLGFEGPKGLFPVGPVSRCSLFEWHARRILAARERYRITSPWYIMTSATNDAETRAYFTERNNFGLGQNEVFFFQQKMLPALDSQGRILLREKHAFFLAPNGHGGTLEALASSGALAHARSRGIEIFSYFQVDNPLARPADPLFVGLHAECGAQMSSKVVEKRDAWEKVGVIGRMGGALGCIEYSDLPDPLRHARAASGRLLFGAGNIAIHLLNRNFIEQLTEGHLQLPWHLARKKMAVVGPRGEKTQAEGIKFETFVFDALARSRESVTLEVARSHEFSPIKNKEGEDSPASARADLTRLFGGWLEHAGLPLPAPQAGESLALEVDPRLAEDEQEFLRRQPRTPEVRPEGHLYT